MLYSRRYIYKLILFSVIVLGCSIPTFTIQNPSAISTAAAQTVLAELTQSLVVSDVLPTSVDVTLTSTLVSPTYTSTLLPTQTLSATPFFTATALIPQISVSVPTNCRNGPGKVYQMEGALLVGEVAQIFGRESTSKYWYIQNPDSSSGYCWVWGEYATITGNVAFLPVYTPPPTPTPTYTPVPTNTPTPSPDFEYTYTSLDSCSGWWVEFKLTNTGSISFRSMGITVKDTDTNITLANFVDGFTDINGCLSSNSRDTLSPGKTYVVSAPAFNYDPSGNMLQTTIILCSEPGQSGICITRKMKFKP